MDSAVCFEQQGPLLCAGVVPILAFLPFEYDPP